MITSESVIKMKNTPNVTDLAGDKVMVDFAQGKYFMLKGVGNDIWDLMDDGMKVADIVAELQKEYEFFKESEEFSGKEIEVTFKLDYNGDLNGKEFSDTFKEGQDFEYVKYKLSQVLGVNPEQIFLFHNKKPIIPVYSICDIDYKPEEVITVQIKSE